VVATDLDARFTFESFVVGPANRLAAAAARRVADAPGTSYNPLFIYSSSGLGEDVFLKLGAIAFEDANTDVAAVLWRRALEMNPDNSSLRTKIEQLGATVAT